MSGYNTDEHQRILKAYSSRNSSGVTFFGYQNLAHVYRIHERWQMTMRLLYETGHHPLSELLILDIGCGNGNMLRHFLQWGANPNNLVGIELRPEPVELARRLSPHLDIRCGSAVALPFPDGYFDLVCQHTVFTSIKNASMKQQIAVELNRVLRPNGSVLWYDFLYDNPRNLDVKGIKFNEVKSLFPQYQVHGKRITLAPFIARRIPNPLLPILYPLLSVVWPLRTHFLGVLTKPDTVRSDKPDILSSTYGEATI
jgi:SAM-dependent methyltransferase